MGWHDERFTEHPGRTRAECIICSRAMWLPKSKLTRPTCGRECGYKALAQVNQHDVSGHRFGRLVALEPVGRRSKNTLWRCSCDCGALTDVSLASLRTSNTRSCGCLKRQLTSDTFRTHGKTDSPIYRSWSSMIQRCTTPTNHRWGLYGGRGIKVCDRWFEFANFAADMGERPAGTSLDRIDVDGDYEPRNCRWATQKMQARNTRRTVYYELDGRRLPLIEWSEIYGQSYDVVRSRVRDGWELERALTTPKHG
ncbi:hypothetical protein X551_02874 [Methylibium sp. T29]|nr:hypothetical protein X551_02874 [Methylibium sp. T29]